MNDKHYFVLYKRDLNGEQMERAGGRMLYDKVMGFDDKQKAAAFALEHLPETPIIARKLKATEHSTGAKCVVAAYFLSKYQDKSYFGYAAGCPPIPTHEVLRCNPEKLEAVVQKLAKEQPDKILIGIEEKLFPQIMSDKIS